jgi:hypothetical protein
MDATIDVLFADLALMDHSDAGLHIAQAAAKHRPGMPERERSSSQ